MGAVKSLMSDLGNTIVGIAKIIGMSRMISHSEMPEAVGDTLIILGNGPSLNDTIATDLDLLQSHPCMAVNFAANSDEYLRIKPRYYILADPHFFGATDDSNVTRLFERIATLTDWQMSLLIPVKFAGKFNLLSSNANIQVHQYNCVGVEGFSRFEDYVYDRRLAMPRPRNILIPAVMTAMQMGYKRIAICGADHSWTRTLSVSDDNKVVTVQPHFYADNKLEQERVTQVYDNIKLYEILNSFYVAFKSYHTIQRYAASRSVDIINATKGSFIDAFRRSPLRDIFTDDN